MTLECLLKTGGHFLVCYNMYNCTYVGYTCILIYIDCESFVILSRPKMYTVNGKRSPMNFFIASTNMLANLNENFRHYS